MDEKLNQKQILEYSIYGLLFVICSGFFISYAYTVSLLKSDTVSLWAFLPVLVIAFVIDGLKTISAFAKSHKKLNKLYRTRAGFFYYMTLCISLLASFAFTTNQSNSKSNIEYTQSLEYKEYLDKKERIELQIQRKEKAILGLENREQKTGKSYITRKTKFINEIDQLNKEIDLIGIPDNVAIKSTHGFISACKLIINVFNLKISPENLKMIIFLSIIFIFEFGLGELARYYNYILKIYSEKYGALFPEGTKKTKTQAENTISASGEEKAVLNLARVDIAQKQEKEKIINFNNENQVTRAVLEPLKESVKKEEKEQKNHSYNVESFVDYYNFMVSDAKEKGTNISKGYKAIAKEINIKESEAQKIKNALELQGIIKSEGNQTVILKMNEDIKKAI